MKRKLVVSCSSSILKDQMWSNVSIADFAVSQIKICTNTELCGRYVTGWAHLTYSVYKLEGLLLRGLTSETEKDRKGKQSREAEVWMCRLELAARRHEKEHGELVFEKALWTDLWGQVTWSVSAIGGCSFMLVQIQFTSMFAWPVGIGSSVCSDFRSVNPKPTNNFFDGSFWHPGASCVTLLKYCIHRLHY